MANYIKSFNFRNGVQVDNDNFIVNAAGRVGIGTTVPDKILDVRGNAKVVGHITATDASVSGIVTVGSITINGNTGTISATNFSGSGGSFGDAPVVAIATAGFIDVPSGLTTTTSIGIGTTSTEFQLQVGGNPTSSVGFGITSGNVSASGNLTINGTSSLNNTSVTDLVAQQSVVTGVSTITILKVGTAITAQTGNIFATTFNGNLIGNVTGDLNSTGVSTVGELKVGTGITASGGIITATTFDGNVATATSLTNSRNFSVTGDIEASSISFDGTSNVSLASTLSNNFSANTSGIITAATIVGSAGSFTSIGIQTSAPTTDLQIKKSVGDAILEVISDNGKSSIRVGKDVGAGTSSASFNYGSTLGFGLFSTDKSLDIINNDIGNLNYFLSNNALTNSAFIWHRGSSNQLMTLTRGGNLGIGITNPEHKLSVSGISTFGANAYFGSNVTVDSNLTVGSNVSITGSLSVPTISSNVSFGGTITATQFIGDGSGLTGVTGTGSGVEIQEDGFAVGTASTINFIGTGVTATISGGVASVEITTSGGGSSSSGVVVEDSGSVVGTAETINFGNNLSVSPIFAGIVTVTASGGTSGIATYADNAGIATYTSEWILGANGTSHYTFTGPGLDGTVNDPEIYLVRGQQYKFTNNMGAHPFKIQSTPNGDTSGTQYNDGIVNNGVSNGTLTWNVQFNTPSKLYYQCTSHENMGGAIIILDEISVNSSANDILSVSSGILSATDAGADKLLFWDDSSGKLSYLSVGTNLTIDADIISASGGDIVNDLTPQLGGNLDVNGSNITGTGNVNLTGVVTATSFSGDGSGLTGIVASGSGIVVKDGGSTVGTAGTIDFGNNLSVSTIHSGIVTVTASGGGGGTLPSRTIVSGSTANIATNETGNFNITGFKSYALMKVGLSTAGWIRLYTNNTSRANDASRSIGEDPTPGDGVIAEVITTGITTQQNISPFTIGGNMDDVVDTTIYVSITNLSETTQSITANLTILQLEQ